MSGKFGDLGAWMPWIVIVIIVVVIIVVLLKLFPGKKLEYTTSNYKSVLEDKRALKDRYLNGEITKEKFDTVDKPLEERAAALEKSLDKMGVGPVVLRAVLYAVFGYTGATTAKAAIERYKGRPPRGGTMSDQSKTAESEGKPASKGQIKKVQEWLASILHTSVPWVKAHWAGLTACLILTGAAYVLVQVHGGVLLPDEPAWVVGFVALVSKLVGHPPPVPA